MGIIKNFLNKYILHPSFLIKEEGDMIQKEEDYCDQFSKIQIDINNIKSSYPEMIRKSLEYDFSLPILSGKSNYEIELLNYMKEIYTGEIISNTKSLIDGELDIYLPELNLAFEFNGLYWHSELYKDKKYHLNKTKQCGKIGIQLIHVWEDDWGFKQGIVKSMISNRISISNRIYARKCDIRIINNNKLVRDFLNKNHLQGFVGSRIKIGLFYNEELISLMTFGSLRKSLNTNSVSGKWELIRFCNKIGYSIVGGSSRLLKEFVKLETPNEIISYSDNSHSNGDMYSTLGFKLDHITEPNYHWVIDGLRKHRFNYRKDKLVKEGFNDNKTEIEIMYSRGYYRIIKALKDICTCYKSEVMGSTEHLSEYFDNGDILLTLSQTTDDSRIKNILSSVAEYCELECEGSAEIILEWITDDDCDYIAKFLGLEPLDYEGDWTKEEDIWDSR